MPSLRDIRRRIKSVKNTAQITKAMQMVAASKMKRAQDAAAAGVPFANKFNQVLGSIVSKLEDVHHPLIDDREDDKPLVFLVSTDKGLCGGLNTNLFREVTTIDEKASFVSTGKKGKQFLARAGKELIADFELSDRVSFPESKQISKFLMEKFLNGEFSSIKVLYPRFKNTLVQQATLWDLLPLKKISSLETEADDDPHDTELDTENIIEYLFEPSPTEVLQEMLPYYVHFLMHQAILSARASEHSARMVAMKTATDNANALVKDLTLEYNRARQASITNEILEIATAQMAMG